MPLDLRQRLSEFSYGYGVTREVQAALESIGLRPVPFLPSLLHEAEIGCDVHFAKPGLPLLLQFKLGHELRHFRRSDTSKPAPYLDKPFWRFEVETSEVDGQYDLLLKAELSGAEVHYVAPRFADWDNYAAAFQSSDVLASSLLIAPSEIDRKLQAEGEPDGLHKVVYDASRVYVCSEPRRVKEERIEQIALRLKRKIEQENQPIAKTLRRVFSGFDQRRDIRRSRIREEEFIKEEEQKYQSFAIRAGFEMLGRSPEQIAFARRRRIESFRTFARSDDDATFAALGVETWAAGCQLVAVTNG